MSKHETSKEHFTHSEIELPFSRPIKILQWDIQQQLGEVELPQQLETMQGDLMDEVKRAIEQQSQEKEK